MFQLLIWGAVGFNPDATLQSRVDRATHVAGSDDDSGDSGAAFNAESQARCIFFHAARRRPTASRCFRFVQGQRARFEAMNSGFHG